jgi:hypothetical protein
VVGEKSRSELESRYRFILLFKVKVSNCIVLFGLYVYSERRR